jgi:hypothetical protein
MTLIPDFGQVQSDNQVLNVSPFEVRFNENRAFFTEGTELFNKGNLFYSRRIGSTPIHYWDVAGQLNANESVLKNPSETKLINATKVSGRTKKGLGIGVFNAITKTMYADVGDNEKHKREIETGPLTNYNIIVFDQTLKNNSSVSFINTNVLRSGKDYDANVSAALFNFNNKKNTYNWNGKFSVSHLTSPDTKGSTGYSHTVGFGKTGGRFNFNLTQEIADEKYDINDMGILFNNNYIDHNFWAGYRWLKPGKWYNRINLNLNAGLSSLYKKFNSQVIPSSFQRFNTNVNVNAQLKSLWFIGAFVGYVPVANDFYEPRKEGRSFRSPSRLQLEAWVETNNAKKYYLGADYFVGLRNQFNSRNHEIRAWHRFRFNDKLSVSQDFYLNPFSNDAGFYSPRDAAGNRIALNDIVFTRRNRTTIENILSAKYNFTNKSGITFRARHYWSKVEQKELYDLQTNGDLLPSVHAGAVSLFDLNQNFFNIDAVYTWQFAPGSFINIVWKNSITGFDDAVQYSYFKNFSNTVSASQNNNLSLKIIYFLDYLNIKK